MINKKFVKISLAVFAGLILYYVILELTGYSFPCVFHRVTGLKCPGCGITHMIRNIIKLDFREAYIGHPFIFVTSPYLIYIVAKEFLFNILNSPWNEKFKMNKADNIGIYLYIAGLVVFSIYRNISIIAS